MASAQRYLVEMEVAGPLAMFARPDTGASPTSYPAPTRSAAKGMLEAIAFLSDGAAWFHPFRVDICKPAGTRGRGVRFQRYAFNYGGPLRKDKNVKDGTGMQVFATVLSDVCFRIHAEVRGAQPCGGRNPAHYLKDLFERRLRQGRCFRTPSLGWSEFTCDYWGPFRDTTEVDDSIEDLLIPSMLDAVWDRPVDGGYVSRFAQDVRVERGMVLLG